MKRKISYIIGIITLFALAGCGTQRAKSDDEILQELNNGVEIGQIQITQRAKSDDEILQELNNGTIQYESQELTIKEIEITDRRTDTDNKKDTVYISMIADNNVVSCEMSYVAEYSLYDQGWILDSFLENNRGSWIIKPVSAPEDNLLEEHSHGNYIYSDILLDEGSAIYYYEEVEDDVYCSTTKLYKTRYEFDTMETKWEYIDSEIIEKESEWDVDGTWSYVKKPGINVMGESAFDSENHHMMMDIKVNSDVAHVTAYTQGDGNVYFNGDITLIPGEGGCSDSVEFSYESPGFMPVVFWGEIVIRPDRVFVNNASYFERDIEKYRQSKDLQILSGYCTNMVSAAINCNAVIDATKNYQITINFNSNPAVITDTSSALTNPGTTGNNELLENFAELCGATQSGSDWTMPVEFESKAAKNSTSKVVTCTLTQGDSDPAKNRVVVVLDGQNKISEVYSK